MEYELQAHASYGEQQYDLALQNGILIGAEAYLIESCMRTTLFLCTFLLAGISQAYSQTPWKLKTDTLFKNFSVNKAYRTLLLGQSNGSLWNSQNLFANTVPKAGEEISEISDKVKSYDRMPCLVPKGYFPMRISKPDTTVEYAMRIYK